MLVIADDFTGANDTGVLFTKNNAVVDIALSWQQSLNSQSDVLVVNTDSRAVPVSEAANRIKQVLQSYYSENKRIYKKVDSTLRGNIGAELEALLNHTDNQAIFFCAALPASKRIVRDGICYVNGLPLLQTEFATDPKTPISSSEVSKIIAKQTALPVIEINLTVLRSIDLLSEINHCLQQHKKCIFSFDAEAELDLATIAQLSEQFPNIIAAGSSGLAAYLPKSYYLSDKVEVTENGQPILFVAASMSEMTARQIEQVSHRSDISIVSIDVEIFFNTQAEQTKSDKIQQILTALNSGQHVILKTNNDAIARANIAQLCEKYGLTRQQLGEQICNGLSIMVAMVLAHRKNQLAALFLTGGDIAIGVATQLGIQRYRILDEIEQGVPVGYFADSPLSHIPVITKAGGFGSIQVLEKVIDFIKN